MQIYRAYKTELDPNEAQKRSLLQHAGAARFAWNWGLAERIKIYEETGKGSSYTKQNRQLNAMKQSGGLTWMYEVSKCAPQNALIDLESAFSRFFRGLKDGRNHGFPRFKSRNRGIGSFRLTGSVHVETSSITLPRLGPIKLKERNYIPVDGKILSVTISERAGHWFAAVLCERSINVSTNSGPPIGVDLGIQHFGTTSDGTRFDAPRPLAKNLKKLKRLQRSHSRKQRGSQNSRKSRRKIARLHYRIACIRKDALHKITTDLAKNHSLVAIEDLKVQNMMKNPNLSKAISDMGWGEFKRQLRYKALWYGTDLRVLPHLFPSTRKCSCCGWIRPERLELRQRTYHCEHCGLEIDRDINAAKNLLLAASSAESLNACGAGSCRGLAEKQELAMTPGNGEV